MGLLNERICRNVLMISLLVLLLLTVVGALFITPVKAQNQIKVAVVRGWGTKSSSGAMWDDLMANHSDILIDYTSLNINNFTYSDIVNTGADVLYFSDCWNTFTDDEVDAISMYVNEGHGIIATFLTFYDSVPNNYKLAPLFGIEQVSPIPASVSFSRNFSLLVPTHPIFNGITDPYTAWYSSCVQGMNVTLATKIAESTDQRAQITTYAASTYSAVYFSNLPEFKSGATTPEDRLVVYNAIVWASAERIPPVADAGPNQAVDEDTLVIFDGSGASDNIGIVDYKWAFTDKTPKTLAGVSPSYIFSTPGTYTVTLTVKDAAGNSATDTVVVTVSDVTNPVADAGVDQKVKVKKTVTFNAGNSSDNAGIVSYEWDFGDGTTGTGMTTTHTYKKGGTYTVTLTVKDAAGNSATDTVVIKVQAAAGFPLWALVPIIGIIGVVAVVVYLKKRKPKEKVPKPAKLGITAEPAAILADGEATSTITIELLDKKGKPVSALADTEVGLTSTGGKIEKPVVRIPKGKETEKTVLISSKEVGPVTLKADVKGLKSASIALAFVEKKRYCMHCGAKMPFTARHCPKCGKAPPAGVDTKACKNCKAVIPIVAKFCAECGASQPE